MAGMRLYSAPARVYWAGWESDTRTLERHGWSVNAYQNLHEDVIGIALRHEESGIHGVSERVVGSRFMYPGDYENQRFGNQMPPMDFRFQALGRPVQLRPSFSLAELRQFDPVDCETAYVESAMHTLEDLMYFRTIKTKRFLLPHDEVDHLMERILKIQEPMREEYFREQAKDARAAAQLHAQILTRVA